MGLYDDFETTASQWLTEVAEVYEVATNTGMGGAQQEGPRMVLTGLKSSFQPRSAFASHTVMGWMPEQSHTWFCKALDENGQQLQIHLGYEVKELRTGRWFKVMAPPEEFIHPDTGKGHHLEIAVKVMAKF